MCKHEMDNKFTQKKIIGILQGVIISYPSDTAFSDEILNSVLLYHPRGIHKFKTQPIYTLRRGNDLFLCNKNGDVYDNIGWRTCVKLFKKSDGKSHYERKKLLAMRNATWSSKKRLDFIASNATRNENGTLVGDCTQCGRTRVNVDVDHYMTPFSEIAKSWETPKHLEFVLIDNRTHFKDNIEAQWLEFHDNIAKYRLLCKSCNASNGNRPLKYI